MTRDPRDTSAAEPDGGNLHVRIQGGPGLGNRPGLLNKRAFDLETETRLIAAYVGTLSVGRAPSVLSQLRCSCRGFRKLHPQKSLLSQAHTTDWVAAWRDVQLDRCSVKVLALRLQATRRWLAWAFEQRVLPV